MDSFNQPLSHRAQYALILLILLAVTGCSMVSHWWRDTTALKTVNIQASEDVNDFSAVMVDLVFVRDKDLVAQLPDNAPEWFSRKQGLLFKYPKELSLRSLQVPPNFREQAIALPDNYRDAQRVLVYANYVNLQGQLPLEITDYPVINLELQKDRVVLTQPD
jgi:hypothetical protein